MGIRSRGLGNRISGINKLANPKSEVEPYDADEELNKKFRDAGLIDDDRTFNGVLSNGEAFVPAGMFKNIHQVRGKMKIILNKESLEREETDE